MKTRVSIDRFEGDRKQIAVLLTDDGQQLDYPKALLPKGAKAGDVLTLEIGRDAEGRRSIAATRDVAVTEDSAQQARTAPGQRLMRILE